MNEKQIAIMKEALTAEEFDKFFHSHQFIADSENPAYILCSAFDWGCEDNEGGLRYWSTIHDRLSGV